MPCPYDLLRKYIKSQGPYINNSEPFFMFANKSPIRPAHARHCLKTMLKLAGFQHQLYNFHGIRAGRSCDLYDLGLTVETIKKIRRWKSNAVYRYLR